MNCHMHQPNMFVNSFLGYTMWDYEMRRDAPTTRRCGRRLYRPIPPPHRSAPSTTAIPRPPPRAGCWGDVDFLRTVADRNPGELKDTQFADYHGHGWNFRAVYKRDRDGNLLDAAGKIVANDDPEQVHRRQGTQFPAVRCPVAGTGRQGRPHDVDPRREVGMQCGDCHFAQDGHGNGYHPRRGRQRRRDRLQGLPRLGAAPIRPCKTSNLAARPTALT